MAVDRFTHERERLAKGCERIVGVDEAGRGPLAGPVVAAAAVFSPRHIRDGLAKPLDEVNDSKRLSAKKRELFFELLQSLDGFEFGVAVVGPEEVDRINILKATHRAMQEALAALGQAPGHLLVDGRPVPALGQAQTALVKGDSLSYSIAAASILAKVTRDRMMMALDREFPGYGFAANKGYGTREHLDALARLGPCRVHRCSFAPIKPQPQLGLFPKSDESLANI
ncbi:MAG: ribonuclease HII [Verrucomicrobia bacterium]|nr:ribonuclease HII [Verrucomicrobiota bacterium]